MFSVHPQIFLLAVIAATASAERPSFATSKIADKEASLKATLFTFVPKQNRRFGILDVPKKIPGDNIQKHFDPVEHELMINGGYFDSDFKPSGYCKIDGKIINSKVAKNLSGFVAIDNAGKVALLAHDDDFSKYPTVLQSGPYVIDPGGKMGIRSKSGKRARRTLIGITTDERLVILIVDPIYLIDLANAIMKYLPKLERLLNLDGGPSTAMIGDGQMHVNPAPVRNYLFRAVAH